MEILMTRRGGGQRGSGRILKWVERWITSLIVIRIRFYMGIAKHRRDNFDCIIHRLRRTIFSLIPSSLEEWKADKKYRNAFWKKKTETFGTRAGFIIAESLFGAGQEIKKERKKEEKKKNDKYISIR